MATIEELKAGCHAFSNAWIPSKVVCTQKLLLSGRLRSGIPAESVCITCCQLW
ncbi:MAG: hypothetical protein ACK58L_14155 [Planctomycetota bacterium]